MGQLVEVGPVDVGEVRRARWETLEEFGYLGVDASMLVRTVSGRDHDKASP